VLSWFGIISVLLALVPVVAISPILLYIGMLIGAQAFQTTPTSHAPAIILALTPHLAAWCKTLMDGALGAAGTSAAAVGFDKLVGQGVLYQGLQVMGGGSILTGLVLGAIGSFVIDRGVRAGGRRADLLRVHARRGDRNRGHARCGHRLSNRRRVHLQPGTVSAARHDGDAGAEARGASRTRGVMPRIR
jgi:hypothetical protein